MSTSPVTPNQDDQTPQVPPMAASPDQGGPSPVVTDGPQSQQPPTPAPAAPQSGSKWANVVKGALAGLAEGGIGGMAVGAIAPKTVQQGIKNQQQAGATQRQQAQAQVRFTDAQAAATQQEAAVRQIQIEQAPEKLQMEIKAADKPQVDAYLAKGIQPAFMSDNNPEAHRAALESYAKANGGSVDSLVTFHYGDKLATFDTSSLAQVPAQLQETNRGLEILGRPVFSNMGQFKNAPKPLQTSAVTDTVHLFNPVPATSADALKSQVQTYTGYLAKAQTLPDDNPNKAQDVKDLTAAIAKIKSAPLLNGMSEKDKSAINVGTTIAKARGAAMSDSKGVEVAGPNGATLLQHQGDVIKNQTPTAKSAAPVNALVKTAEDSEKSYQMFQQAYSDYKSGTDTGAQSMLALSQHLATTFGNVKGARVTKDMIQEHLGARSISDSALVATQKLSNGDALSPSQWEAFRGLITQSRRFSWGTASTSAQAKGLSIKGLVPKDLGGTRDISNPSASPTKTADPLGIR